MAFGALFLLAAMVYTLIQLGKNAQAGEWKAVVTIVTAWVAGILAILVFVHSAWAAEITLDKVQLDDALSWGDYLIAGFAVSGLAAAFTDYRKARDNTDTAKIGGGAE